MALLKMGALVTQISGKIGGQSFGVSKGGAYIKNIGSQIQPKTQLQRKQRAITGSISSIWRTLSPAQRLSFVNKASEFPYTNRVGDTKFYSGFNLFQKLNQGMAMIGENAILDAPSKQLADESVVELDDLTTSQIFLVGQDVSPTFKYVVFATNSLSNGISNPLKYFKSIQVLTSGQLDAGINISNNYQPIFGKPVPGSTIHFGIVPVNVSTGYQNGISQTFSGIVP